jgi:hypothetical protein
VHSPIQNYVTALESHGMRSLKLTVDRDQGEGTNVKVIFESSFRTGNDLLSI